MPPASKAVKPTADGTYLYLDPASFNADFARGLPAAEVSFMSRSQVFLSVKAASAGASSPAWKTKPSYGIVATQDRAINPDLERSMYKRANAQVTEVRSSHVAYMVQPRAVAAVIEKAATAKQ